MNKISRSSESTRELIKYWTDLPPGILVVNADIVSNIEYDQVHDVQ